MEVAIISMARGFSFGDICTSMEKLPSASGVTRSPFTLSVASGDVNPATVTVSLATIMSAPGDVTSSSSPAVGAVGVGEGTVVGTGNGADVGSGGGRSVGVGAVGTPVTAREGAGVAVGLGVAMGLRVPVGWGIAVVDTGAAFAGGNVAVGETVTSWPPQAAAKESSTRVAIPSHLLGKVLTHIPAPQ